MTNIIGSFEKVHQSFKNGWEKKGPLLYNFYYGIFCIIIIFILGTVSSLVESLPEPIPSAISILLIFVFIVLLIYGLHLHFQAGSWVQRHKEKGNWRFCYLLIPVLWPIPIMGFFAQKYNIWPFNKK